MNIPPARTFGDDASRLVHTSEHDPRTCPACAELFGEEEREALADPSQWEDARVVRPRRYRRGRRPSVVVSVRFDRDEFEELSAAAERLDTYVSGFVRTAALNAARRGGS